MFEFIAFYAFAAIAIIASLLVIGQRNPMYSVILLIVSFGALAGLYVLLDAPFTAVTQIIIYAGAIMVLFLFVVMLLNVPREEAIASRLGARARRTGAVLSLVFTLEIVWALTRLSVMPVSSGGGGSIGSVARIGTALFTTHAFAFEATSLLILVAMVGAVVLARKEHH
ncbi:MAG: NADH-quinone oxidoreductase subunit J [Acidobacteria bacterium]|nr:MAG: NADH-quinone oxidoreductase subunit J [Acidobacteriota bacterium]PYR79114.1 MAG: NADH-quinone oxidoreductase subunit J [Acidobacteriota bacterium]